MVLNHDGGGDDAVEEEVMMMIVMMMMTTTMMVIMMTTMMMIEGEGEGSKGKTSQYHREAVIFGQCTSSFRLLQYLFYNFSKIFLKRSTQFNRSRHFNPVNQPQTNSPPTPLLLIA